MSSVIIGIHGLGNKPPRRVLEIWWKASIREGFKRAGRRKERPVNMVKRYFPYT